MLRLANVCVGDRLRDVSVDFERGQRWVIVGPNGAGKSTLIKAALGLEPLSSGQVLLAGHDTGQMPRRQVAQACAWVPQHTDEASGFTGLELALMGRLAHVGPLGLTSPADAVRARELFASLHAAHLVDKSLAEASGGERRLAFLVRALMQAPKILFLDEPTAFLDLKFQLEALRRVRDLSATGLTSVVVLHDLNLAASFATHALLLKGGRVEHAGPSDTVFTAQNLSRLFEVDIARVGEGPPLFAVRSGP